MTHKDIKNQRRVSTRGLITGSVKNTQSGLVVKLVQRWAVSEEVLAGTEILGRGGRGRQYLRLHCLHHRPCFKMGSDESQFNVSSIVRDGNIQGPHTHTHTHTHTHKVLLGYYQSQDCVHRPQVLKRGVSRSGIEMKSSAYQPNAIPPFRLSKPAQGRVDFKESVSYWTPNLGCSSWN